MIEYILNRDKNKLHVRVDGMTHENCNVDQMQNYSLSSMPPEGGWWWCARCIVDHRKHRSAGGVS